MPPSDDDAPLLVLLALRLKGFADAPALARRIGLTEQLVRAELERFRSEGLVLYREGRLTGWSLTSAGREEGARRLARQLDTVGHRSLVVNCYTQFVEINRDLLAACTDWQMVDATTLNDHTDPAYDVSVIERLADVHARVTPLCADLSLALERFAAYGPLLSTALYRLRAGEYDYFTSVRLPSYHTVWFELHEDLMATLGLERG
jgi:hypothetical protein